MAASAAPAADAASGWGADAAAATSGAMTDLMGSIPGAGAAPHMGSEAALVSHDVPALSSVVSAVRCAMHDHTHRCTFVFMMLSGVLPDNMWLLACVSCENALWQCVPG